MKDKNIVTVRLIVEDALIAALAMVLNSLKPNFPAGFYINISLGFIPVAFLALRKGVVNGMISGLIFGILDLFLRGIGTSNVVSVLQAFFEYIVAFTLIGLAGVVREPLKNAINQKKHREAVLFMFLGIFIGCLAKFLCHTIASATFFSKYLSVGKNGSVWLAAFIYQAPSFGLTFAIAAGCLILVYVIRPSLFES